MTRKSMKTIAFALAMMAMSTATYGQNGNGNRPSREQMIETQANTIAQQLGLDSKTAKKFLSVYKSEQADMRELMPQRGGMPSKGSRSDANGQKENMGKRSNGANMGTHNMSEEDQKKVASLKEKYNKKYSKFLNQEQITQMYKLQEQQRSQRQFGGRR